MRGFHVRRLRVRRFLGVIDGYDLADLAPGINLVYGPNGSGKTTTARALEALMWPKAAAPPAAALDATVEVGEERWTVRLDAGLVEHQQDGVNASPPPTAPAEDRDRYRLWLPDLLRADDAGFARSILIESSGGYDLEAAARSLERRRPLHRQRPQQEALRQARDRVREARAAQEQLTEEAALLSAKEARLATRAELELTLRRAALALEHAEARTEVARAAELIATFPDVIGRLRGDEADRLAELRERIEEASRAAAEARQARDDADRQVRRIALPPAALDGTLLHRLEAEVERLAEIDRDIAEAERVLATTTSALNEEEAPLAPIADPHRLAAVELGMLAELERAAEEFDGVRGQRQRLEAQLAELPEQRDVPEDLEKIHHGLSLLRQWLASDDTQSRAGQRARQIALAGNAVAAVAGVVLLVASQIGAGILVLAAVAGLLYLLLRPTPRGSSRADREHEYLHLGLLEAPDAWEPGAVEACRIRLEERAARVRELDLALRKRCQLVRDLEELERRGRPAADRLRAAAERVGIGVEEAGVRILWLVQRVSRWQKARADRASAEAALVETCRAHREVLEQANEQLAPLGHPPFTESRAVRAVVEKLRQDAVTHQRHADARDSAAAAFERASDEMRRLQADADALLERAGIAAADEPRLREWCGRVDAFRAAGAARDAAEQRRQRLQERLIATSGFEDGLLGMAEDELHSVRTELVRELEGLAALGEEVGALRARVAAAKSAHALEEALAEEERSRHALLELRDREIRAAAASALVEYLERETRNEHLPEVFHRANELFSLVTRGAYSLRLGKGDPPTFRAVDTRTERGHSLEELSSGTRVQLLLAVRIAFVEALEGGVALPLLMDETLANSDDERAASIMDAVIELAATGRQIFYFTAQPDEIAKWRRALAERPAVEWSQIDLGAVRRLEQRLDPAAIVAPVPEPVPPLPEGIGHADLLELLPVPRIDLGASPGTLHLWYLVEDPHLLHRLLYELRVDSWGQLRALAGEGGLSLVGADRLERVQVLATVATGILTRLAIGRGRPVDRVALLASGAVSERFIEEVDGLCRSLNGDGTRLVEALENRSVAGFYKRNAEALRTYLEEERHLDRRASLPLARIRREVLAEAATLMADRKLTFVELDRLLARLVQGAGLTSLMYPDPAEDQPQLWPEPMA